MWHNSADVSKLYRSALLGIELFRYNWQYWSSLNRNITEICLLVNYFVLTKQSAQVLNYSWLYSFMCEKIQTNLPFSERRLLSDHHSQIVSCHTDALLGREGMPCRFCTALLCATRACGTLC